MSQDLEVIEQQILETDKQMSKELTQTLAESQTTEQVEETPTETPAEKSTEVTEETAKEKTEEEPNETAETQTDEEDVVSRIENFAFTEDADDVTLANEREELVKLLKATDAPPALITLIDGIVEENKTLKETSQTLSELGDIQDIIKTNHAVNSLLEFVEKDGQTVPNVAPFSTFLKTEFGNDRFRETLAELNTLPSDKYEGLTQMQEFMQDEIGVSPREFEDFLQARQQGTRFALTPEYIPRHLAQAYNNLPDTFRSNLNERWSALVNAKEQFAYYNNPNQEYYDPTTAEIYRKEIAELQPEIEREIANLQNAQAVIDLNQEKARQEAIQKQQLEDGIAEALQHRYVETADKLEEVLRVRLTEALKPQYGESADLESTLLINLITNAYSQIEVIAEPAQKKLQKYGIVADWAVGREILDELIKVQGQLVRSQKTNDIPRSIKTHEQKERAVITKLTDLMKPLLSSVTKKLLKGSNQVLEQKAKQPSSLFRKQVVGNKNTTSLPNNKRTSDDIDKEIRRLDADIYKQAIHGDLSVFK